MTSHPDPAIVQMLQAFARRRRRLILLRGGLATLAVLIAAMLVVAALDYWLPLLRDWVRWALSATAYAAVLGVAWRLWLRPLLDVPDARQLARLVEHAAPALREDLLSAVELGHASAAGFDSAQFRALLQSDVALRVRDLKVKSLLPVGLLKRYINVMALIGLVVVGLIGLSGLRFGALLLRALMPGANLDRVSATRIVILEPNPASQTVPQGDALRLEIELQGELAGSARLETEGASQGRVVTEMTPLGKHRFATAIQVGRENLRYRVQAGDALTRRYDLTAVARPYEVAFDKTYQYPAYSRIPPKSVREAGGGLACLEGAAVDLKITTSQPVRQGELRVEQGARNSVVPLEPLPDGRMHAIIPLTGSGSYRVHLVAAGSGFENKFSPEYELRAEPDLPPTIKLEEPDQDLVAAADQSVTLAASAGDDIGLARIVQRVKVNEGAWSEAVLQQNAGRQAHVEREWDLAAEGVKPGDVITSQVVATDLKGNRAESRSLQILIVANRETNRVAGLESRNALYQALKSLAACAAALDDASSLAHDQFDQSEDTGPNRKPVLASLATAHAECEAKLALAWAALDVPLRAGAASHESSDLVLLGRLLGGLHHGELLSAGQVLGLLAANPAMPAARELVREIHAICGRVKSLTAMARDVDLFNLSAGQVDVAGELCLVLGGQAARVRTLALASKTPEDWLQVATRLRALLSVSKNVDVVLESIKAGGGPLAGDAGGLLDGALFQDERELIEQEMLAGRTDDRLMDRVVNLNRRIGTIEDRIGRMRENLSAQARQAAIDHGKVLAAGNDTPAALIASMHQQLMEDVAPTWSCVDQLRREPTALAAIQQLLPQDRAALGDARWRAMADLFKAHADLEETRALADNAFVNDLRRATVAAQTLQALAPGDGAATTGARLDMLDQSLRLLESGHNLMELVDGSTALAALERWEFRMPQGRTTERRDWAWLSTRLQMMPNQLTRLELKDESARKAVAATVALLNGIPGSPPFLTVGVEMGKRRNLRYAQSARGDLEQVAAKLRAALAPLHQAMDIARQNLAKLAPRISELALALAKEEAELEKDSTQHAATAATAEPADNSARARPQLARQQQLNLKIDSLKDLIRADANEQNILKKDERDRMRDADDALAMLKEPPPAAEKALLLASQDTQAPSQTADLQQAVAQEQNVVDALIRIGHHYEALEQGKSPDETRLALREAEEAAGLKAALDEQFAQAEMIAQMAEQSPADLLKELEAKLPANPDMQRELDQISNNDLAVAKDLLERAAKQEAAVAKTVDEQNARDLDPKAKLTTLEAARLTATLIREAQVAAEAARQLMEQAANAPGMEQARSSNEQAAAVPLADELVEVAQRMENAPNADEVLKESTAAIEKVGLMVPHCDQARGHANPAAQLAKTEAQKPGEQQPIYQQAEPLATLCAQKCEQAMEAARLAEAAARLAAERAQAMAKIPQGAPQNIKLAMAALQQVPVKVDAAEAALYLDRAGRHEQRLAKPEAGQMLTDLAAQVDHAVKTEVSDAEKSLRDAPQAAQAQAPTHKASAELARLADALKLAAESPLPSSPMAAPPGAPASTATPAEQQAMARTLDALDQQLTEAAAAAAAAAAKGGPPMPGSQPGPPGPPGGMAQAAMASMRQGRSPTPSPMPGMPSPLNPPMEKSLGGAKLQAAPPSQGQAPEMQALTKGDWGKLPKKLAEQLTNGQTETIPAEYREAVATYYRVVAEKSKKP